MLGANALATLALTARTPVGPPVVLVWPPGRSGAVVTRGQLGFPVPVKSEPSE